MMASLKFRSIMLMTVIGTLILAPASVMGSNPCIVPDNGTGTITLPPIGCEYVCIDEVFEIIDGLPPGTTIEMEGVLRDFTCCGNNCTLCSLPLGPNDCEMPGGSLGGDGHCFEATLDLTITGTGELAGFNHFISVRNISFEVHTGPRNPGEQVQTFPTDMYSLQGEHFGDPYFCTFRIRAGTYFGLPSPGETTLTETPSGDYAVDSFFDITYQIEFEGCPDQILADYSGTTTATIRMRTGEIIEECAAKEDGTGCKPVNCPDPNYECQPRCVKFDPNTYQTTVLDCECRDPNECHVDIPEPTWPCIVPDNGSGTATLPPIGCEYTSPNEVFMIIDGLPPGTTIEMEGILKDFTCCGNNCTLCTMPLGPNDCEMPGGSLGGDGHCFEATLDLTITGTGELAGFNHFISVRNISFEVHTGPRNPGDREQVFPTELYYFQGEHFGDPYFCTFRINAGTGFGLPSPGQTTLTKLPSGDFAVDSFFDITYQIEFEGCPDQLLADYSGTTTATIRMETGSGSISPPRCVGDCLCWEFCNQTTIVNPDGTIDICCDCIPDADLNRDGVVDFKDFAIMANQWLRGATP